MAYYQAARDRANSDLGRNMFEFLRSSEEGHIARIHEIYREVKHGGAWPAPIEVADADAERRQWQSVFGQALDAIRGQETLAVDDLGALKQAAEFERDGQEFYRACAAGAVDPLEKRFYEQLAHEEYHHLDAISDSIQLLEDPQGFFADREQGTQRGA
jgi:rubrerythrin